MPLIFKVDTFFLQKDATYKAAKTLAIDENLNFIEKKLTHEFVSLCKQEFDIVTVSLINDDWKFQGFNSVNYEQNAELERVTLINQIMEICATSKKVSEEDGLLIECLLTDYLSKYPFVVEMWMRLAKLEFSMLWQDPDKIRMYLENALNYDPKNTQVILLMAYWEYHYLGYLEDGTFSLLSQSTSLDKELESLLEYAKSFRYNYDCLSNGINCKEYESRLLDSVLLCNRNVNSYKELGFLYIKQNKIQEAIEYLEKALQNISRSNSDSNFTGEPYDITNIEDFFNYFYRGITTSPENLLDALIKLKNKFNNTNK